MTSHKQQFVAFFGYDGRRFHGVAPQLEVPTAGSALLARLSCAGNVAARAVSFAARTDAGVSARQNLASFRVERGDADGRGHGVAPTQVIEALQAHRNDGLVDVHAIALPRRVMARTMVAEKHYCYRLAGPDAPGPSAGQTWHLPCALRLPRLRRALALFCGRYDFSAFCYGGRAAGSAVRTIRAIHIEARSNEIAGYDRSFDIAIHIHGEGFLRRMVRMMVCAAVEAACGLRPVHSIERLLRADTHGAERQRCCNSAPARGLTLEAVTLTPQAAQMCRLEAPS